MHPTARDQLIALNARFYQEFAADFAATRQRLQPGVMRLLPTLLLDGRLLDLGCGNGELARRLVGRGFKGVYIGIDFSAELLAFASPTPPYTSPPSQVPYGAPASPPSQVPYSAPASPPSQVSYSAPASPPSQVPYSAPVSPLSQVPYGAPASPPSPWNGEGGRGGEVYPRSTSPALWNKLKPVAREMRHEPTPAENALWQALRNRQFNNLKFRRQHPIDRFIVDFYCPSIDLVIEVDGPIHQYTVEEDALRQQFLESIGLHILRFTNDQVLTELPTVLATIRRFLAAPFPSPSLVPSIAQASPPSFVPSIAQASPPSPFYGEGGRGGEVIFLLSDLSSPTWGASLPSQPFDAILSFAVLHHLPDAGLRLHLLQQVRQHLAPGGRFICSVWQFHHSPRLAARILPWETIGLTNASLDPGDTLLDWRQGGHGLRYVHLFSEDELSQLALSSGFTVQDSFYSDGRSGDLALYQVWS